MNRWTLLSQKIHKPYDVNDVISEILDSGAFLEVQASFAANIVVGFGRLNGSTIGVNQPKVLAGCLDIDASTKPLVFAILMHLGSLVTLVDVLVSFQVPIKNGEGSFDMVQNYSTHILIRPKMTVIMRKAYGGAYDVMCSKHIRADYNVAWPSAELAVMGADGAVQIIHRRRIHLPGIQKKSANAWWIYTEICKSLPSRPWNISMM